MLQAVADLWWPRIHREIVLLAQSCSRCQKAGENLKKTIQKQSEYGKLPAAETHNDEIAIDFAGPFKLSPKAKKYLLVSIDHKTNSPNAVFVKKPTAETVIIFLNAHIAQFGIPKRIRTDPQLYSAAKHLDNFAAITSLNISNAQSATTAETEK